MKSIRITIFFILIAGILLAFFVPIQRPEWGKVDLLPYWSASLAMLSGGNPYDPVDLFSIQKEIRPSLNQLDEVDPAWGPPWTMLILSPLTFIRFEIAVRILIILNIVFITIALYLLWTMLFSPGDRKALIITLAIGFLFGNTIRLIELGQYSAILLLALVLMIWSLNRKLYIWAGITLLILTIKPQVTYLVIAVIFFWAFRYRIFKIFYGFVGSGLLLLMLLWLIFPNWLGSYLMILVSIPDFTIYYTTVGSFIESIFGFSLINYIGLLILLFAFPLSKNVRKMGWLTTLNIALLISVPLAPYGFSFDHVLLLPAIVQMFSWIWKKNISGIYAWMVGVGIFICFGLIYIFMSIPSGLPYYWLIWPSIGIAFIFLLAWVKNKSIMMQS